MAVDGISLPDKARYSLLGELIASDRSGGLSFRKELEGSNGRRVREQNMSMAPDPDGASTSSAEDAARPRRERKWRVRLIGAGAALAVLLVAGSAFSALSIRHELVMAERAMRLGREQLLAGNASDAEKSFVDARDRFAAARGGPAGLVFRALGWAPFVGNSPRTTLAIAQAGSVAAAAGESLARAVAELPGGLTALAPADGVVSIEALAPLTDAVVQADGEVADALDIVDRSPSSLLVGPVAHARSLAEEELGSLQGVLHSGSLLLQGLPAFLGQDGSRKYFFSAQDPAELRGTGGVLGAFSILTIGNGSFHFSPFKPIQSLPIPPLDQVPPPSAEYARNYNQFRGAERFWLSINLTPDVPTAARAILDAYAVATGTRLDGVIITDPFALKALLRVTGPATIPGLGRQVTAASVVPFVMNEAFSLFPKPDVRKKVLGSVASGVFDRFINHTKPSIDDLRILAEAAAEGHIFIYSSDPTMEEGLGGTAAGGAFEASPGDFFSVIENSSGANKVDFYENRSTSYTVALGPDGSAQAIADIRFTNHAPTSGQPGYVIGPHAGYSKAGEAARLLNVYCGTGCGLESAYRDGTRVPLWSGSELGHPFYQDYFRTPSGATSDLVLDLFLPHAWEPSGNGGVYRLTFLNQTTVRPSTLRVEVQAPPGAHIVSTSPSMRVEGDSAIWSGVPPRRLELSVEVGS